MKAAMKILHKIRIESGVDEACNYLINPCTSHSIIDSTCIKINPISLESTYSSIAPFSNHLLRHVEALHRFLALAGPCPLSSPLFAFLHNGVLICTSTASYKPGCPTILPLFSSLPGFIQCTHSAREVLPGCCIPVYPFTK